MNTQLCSSAKLFSSFLLFVCYLQQQMAVRQRHLEFLHFSLNLYHCGTAGDCLIWLQLLATSLSCSLPIFQVKLNSSQTCLLTSSFLTVNHRRHSYYSRWKNPVWAAAFCLTFTLTAGCLYHTSHSGWVSRGPTILSQLKLTWELELPGT